MSKGPVVSVVIPAYNAAPFLAATLDSVFAQTYENLEVIVVDDGSKDDTAGVVEPYRGRLIYHRQENQGLPGARNMGFQLASGEFIAWMDSDDLCVPERIAVQAAYLTHNPAVAAIGSDFAAIDVSGRPLDQSHSAAYYSEFARYGLSELFPHREQFDGRNIPWFPSGATYEIHVGDVWRRLIFGNFMHPPTMMMRRSAVAQVGKLREGITSAEDWEYITRLSRVGDLAFVNTPLLRYRRHPNQMSRVMSATSTVSRITVLEETRVKHAEQLRDLESKIVSQLVDFHQDAAYTYAELNRGLALTHLWSAMRLEPKETRVLFHLARILAPKSGLELLRRLRGNAG